MKLESFNAKNGQVMLITVLALSGTILGATTIAGLLMLYQIRQAGDIINSAKAVFAADAGLEHQLYQFLKEGKCDKTLLCGGEPECQLTNDASYSGSCILEGDTVTIRSKGSARKGAISRAFEIQLSR